MNPISGLRARPLLADSLLAVLLAAFTLLESTQPGRIDTAPAVLVPATLLITLSLAFRRRAPLAVLILILAVNTVAVVAATATASAGLFVALLVGVYTVFTRCSRRTRLTVVPFLLAGAALQMARDPATHSAVEALPTFAVLGAVVMLAQVVRRSRSQAERLHRLAAELAASRARAEELAVAGERLRIAREMHDVLAHGVSVMVLQVGAARMALHDTAPQVRGLLGGVENLGREALEELREILGLLRDPVGGADAAESLAPPIGDLDRLFSTMRVAGLPLVVRGAEQLSLLPDAVARTVFRIVQEALTNTLKHAGTPETTVDIEVDLASLTLDVREVGLADSAPVQEARPAAELAGGHGLIGLRERVGALGGTLDVGPLPSGGWQVRAVLPLAREAGPRADVLAVAPR